MLTELCNRFSNMCTSLMHFDCLFSCLNMLVDVYKCVNLLFKIIFVISTFVISSFSFTRKSSKVCITCTRRTSDGALFPLTICQRFWFGTPLPGQNT